MTAGAGSAPGRRETELAAADAPAQRAVYLDHNATTPVWPEVRAAMEPFWAGDFGNPSSIHRWGRAARQALETARSAVATELLCAPEEVYFTSGGTEADNWALLGTMQAAPPGRRRLVTTAIEHYAVLRPCRQLERLGCEVVYVTPGPDGRVDPDAVAAAVDERTALVSVMHANNETGVIQPVAAIGAMAWQRGVAFHVDAVQTLGRLPLDVDAMGADLVSLSAHKVNGPKGVGALYVRRGMALGGLLHGGAQERGGRAGTENVAGAAGFGRAAQLHAARSAALTAASRRLRDRLEAGILQLIDGTWVNGHPVHRLGHTANIGFRGIPSDALVRALDRHGVAAASGSACAAEERAPSHVLLAMGQDAARADGAVRFSLGWGNADADVDYVLEVLPALVQRLRAGR